ncbi:hypothetical protein BHE74_00027283 [Ensete ventricosum]|nr:hypothetical protein BHE74_00027283 [Ensete ventricosum]
MRNLCGMRVQEDDEGYYILHIADWAPRDSSAVIRARWPNLSYQTRVWDDPEATSEFDRGVLHPTLTKDLYTLPLEVLIARAIEQIVLADNARLKSGLDELSSRLDEVDKELNELREGLAESQRQLKEQKVDRRTANDELLKLMRENESLKAELSGKSVANYKQSVGFGWGLRQMGQVSYNMGISLPCIASKPNTPTWRSIVTHSPSDLKMARCRWRLVKSSMTPTPPRNDREFCNLRGSRGSECLYCM